MAWEQLLVISEEARAIALDEALTPPVACPKDGEPLRDGGARAMLHCPYCGFTWGPL